MSRSKAIIRKFKLFVKRFSKYQKILIVSFILIGGFVVFYSETESQLPAEIWLPRDSRHETDDGALDDLIVDSKVVTTKYGKAILFTSTPDRSRIGDRPWKSIYEFRASPLLDPSSCPNITDRELFLPSGCDKVTSFQGQPVYMMRRSYASNLGEFYFQLGETFIYMPMIDQSPRVDTFASFSYHEIGPYLANNSKLVNAIKEKQQTEKAAAE